MKMCFSYFSSVAQLYPILCDPMHRSTPGLSVHHKLLEFTQTHAHRVSDAIQPSLSLSPPSPPAPNPSQHQGLFQWVNSSHEVAKVLELCLHRAKKCDNFLIMPSSPSFLKLFLFIKLIYFSYCCSVTQLIQTFYNPMDCSMPGVLHYLPESVQHMSIESIMSSNRLIFCHSPLLVLHLSQHQSLFQWLCSSNQVAKVFIFN